MTDTTEHCPYCDAPMEPGVLVGAEIVHRWVPGDVVLVRRSVFPGERVGTRKHRHEVARLQGFRCTRCRRMILRY